MTQIIEVLQGGQPVNVEFPDDMSLQEIGDVLRRELSGGSSFGETFAPTEPVVEAVDSTTFEELKRGFSRLNVDFGAFAQSFSNPEEAALEALRKQAEVGQKLGKAPTLEDAIQAYKEEGVIGASGEVLKAIPRITAQQLPTTATVLGGTAAATALMPVPQLKPVAGLAGGFAALYPQLYSQNIQRQAEADMEAGRDVDISRTKAAVAAVGQTAAEQLATYFTFGKGLVSRLLGLRPNQVTQRSSSALVGLARDTLGGVARGAAVEMPTEVAQQVIERAQADLDVLSDEAIAEYGEAGYMAAIAGGTIGGVSGAASPIFTPTTVEQPGQLPTTEDLSEATQPEDIVTPDLPTTEPTPDLSEDTTLPPLEERLSLIAPNLRGTLKGRGLDDVGLELSTRLDPKALQGMRDPDEVDAIFDPDLNTIFLGADRIKGFEQMDTPQLQREFGGLVDHEMVHAVKRMNLWKDSEWKVLENAVRRRTNARGRTYMDAALSDYSKETSEIQTEEAVAELIRDTLSGRTGLAGQPLSLIQRFVEFFRKMGNALTGTGYASFNQVVNDIETGVTGGRPRVAQPQAEATIIGEPALASRGLANQARNRQGNPLGINVRQDRDGTDYASLIASGQKAYESRESRSLDPYVGKRVGLVRTGAGPASLVGYAEVGTPIEANESTFNELREEHLVPQGSTFDIKEGQTKFLYPMLNPEAVAAQELPSSSRGIVARSIGEPALASRKKVGYLPSADPLTIFRTQGDTEFDGTENALQTFLAKKAGYNSEAEWSAALKAEEKAYRKYADDPLAVREALVKGENPFGEKDEYKLREQALGLISRESGINPIRDPKGYKYLREIIVGTKRRPEPFRGVYENVLSTDMTKDEVIEELDEMFNLGSTSERATRQGISVVPSKPLASRRALRQDDNRLQQAKEQGFDTDRILYHFTDKFQFGGKEFEELIPSPVGKLGPGIYTSPDPQYSETYLDSPEIRGSRGIPIYARGRIANQDDYQAALDFARDDYRSRTSDPINNMQVKRLAKTILEEQGFTGLEMNFPRGQEVVIFDPKNVRSVNAEFDPRATDSTRLLASRKRLPLTPQEQELSGRAILESGGRYDESSNKLVTRQLADILDGRVEELFGKKLNEQTPENKEIISNVMVDEALSELDAEGNAAGWYKKTIEDMISTFEQMYPEASQNPDNVDAFKFILAITSNGASVPENTRNALSVFDEYMESGTIPIRGFGKEAKAMEKAFAMFGQLENDLGSKRAVYDLLNKQGTVRDILAATGKRVSGENINTTLPYSAIFGPKIGIFFQNLNGKWDFLTMDRWFMKTWGRYTGTNTPVFEEVFPKRAATLREEISRQPRLKGYRKDKLMRDDQELMRFAEEKYRVYERGGFKDRSDINKKSKNLYEAVTGVKVAPTSGGERTWIREVTNDATRKLRDAGYDMDNATLQALLWYGEKKIYGNHGIINKKSEPTDYATEINRISESRRRPSGRPSTDNDRRSASRVGRTGREAELSGDTEVRQRERDSAKLKTKPEDSAALAVDQSKAATEVRGNPEADQAAAAELQQTKKLASRSKASDIVTSTAYNRVADVASKRASRGQGNINNALPFEAPSSADDRGIVYQLQDKYIDLKKSIEAIKANQRKRGLTPLKDTENPYLGEESMHGIIGNKFNRFQQDEITPLAKKLVATKIPRKELEEFLVLRHAIERNENVRNLNAASKNPRPELADGGAGSLNGQRLVDSYVKSEMQNKYGLRWNDSTNSWEGGNNRAGVLNDLAADFDAITRGTLQELKDSGLINQDSLDKLNTHYKYYAPLRGLSPDEDIAIEEHSRIARGSNNLSIGGIETEKATGRVSEAMPPLGQIIFQRQNAIRRGTINDVVGQRMLNVIREHPNDNYWKIHEDRSYAGVAGNELFGVKEDGKQYFVEFKDKRLRDAMLSLDAAQTGKILGFLRGVNRYLSAVLTSYNPDFVAPNFVRDLGTAINNLVGEQTMVGGKAVDTDGLIGKVIADVGPSVREVYRGLRGKKLNKKLEQDWKDYMESGAKTEWFHVKSPEESSRDIDDLIAMAQGTFKGNMKAGKDAIAGLVSDVNGAIENGVRFATFKNARDLFIENGDSRAEAVAKAATLAKNLTVNFNRKGNSGELLNGLYLFFNASVQGTANFLRGMSSPAKQRMLLAMAGFGSLVTYLNEMVSEEDEDGKSVYANLPSYVKERNLVLMKNLNPFYEGKGDDPYTIPLPYGYNVLHVLGVNTMETILGLISPQDAAARVTASALGSFSPVGFGTSSNPVTFAAKGLTPQIGKPIAEILLNEDFFGSPVYTEPFDFGPQIPLANLSQRSTPEVYKQTTKFLNELTGGNESRGGEIIDLGWVSPDALHHLVGTFIGGTGKFVERAGKTAAAGSDYLQGEYVEDDLSINDVPILRRFMYESTGREGMSSYYDRKDDILAADRQAGLLKGSERGEFIRENRPLLLMKRMMESADKRIRNINRRLAVIGERILTSPSIEATIKLEEEQKRLEDLKIGAYNRFNKRFNERVGPTK